ncbi:MAG: winged helix-turn-helix domain-containing tetratricopeptide repeat protein [Acidobacteriota bacterium]
MGESGRFRPLVRFGLFEADLRTGELRKGGAHLRLQKQPFQVLAQLVQSAGTVVTREELCRKLWPDDTFVDFDNSLNTAIYKIRSALGDSADNPRFIETISGGQGYRFIAPVEDLNLAAPATIGTVSPSRAWIAVLVLLLLLSAVVVLKLGAGWEWWLKKAPETAIRSLAVLPLENLSRLPEQEYFTDGMTDMLISHLGRISGLRVISRTSVMQYKGVTRPLPEIAKELNVDAIIEGSVLRAGNRVRIALQLIEAGTDRHRWANSYERSLSDILSLQAELSQEIAREIKVALTEEEMRRQANARSIVPAAYEAYLKGEYFRNKFTFDGLIKSVRYFEEAMEKDSNFSLPYASLAASYNILAILGALPSREASSKAKAALLKALEIDKTARTHAQLGFVYSTFDWDWTAAERSFRQALRLNPNDALARYGWASYLSAMGRHDEALEEIEVARTLDPLSAIINSEVIQILYHARRYDQAIAQGHTALELDANFPPTHFFLSKVYFAKQQYEEATVQLLQARTLLGIPQKTVELVRESYSKSGWSAALRQDLGIAMERGRTSYPAEFYAVLGEREMALQALERAFEQRSPDLLSLNVNPLFDTIRREPRFQSLLARMHFER